MEEYEALTRAIAALSGGAAAETGGGEPLPREDGPEILEFEPEGPEVFEFEPQGEE
jgi:hypothetical protein